MAVRVRWRVVRPWIDSSWLHLASGRRPRSQMVPPLSAFHGAQGLWGQAPHLRRGALTRWSSPTYPTPGRRRAAIARASIAVESGGASASRVRDQLVVRLDAVGRRRSVGDDALGNHAGGLASRPVPGPRSVGRHGDGQSAPSRDSHDEEGKRHAARREFRHAREASLIRLLRMRSPAASFERLTVGGTDASRLRGGGAPPCGEHPGRQLACSRRSTSFGRCPGLAAAHERRTLHDVRRSLTPSWRSRTRTIVPAKPTTQGVLVAHAIISMSWPKTTP